MSASTPARTGDGLVVVACYPPIDRSKLPVADDQIVLLQVERSLLSTLFFWRSDCPTRRRPRRAWFSVFGERRQFTITDISERVIKAMKSEVIHCCRCGLAIFPDDPIVLYQPSSIQVDRAWCRYADDTKQAVIGCMRWDCDESAGGLFCGHWNGQDIDRIDWSKYDG